MSALRESKIMRIKALSGKDLMRDRCSLRGQISSSDARQRRNLSTNGLDFARTSCLRSGGSEPFHEISQEIQFAVIFSHEITTFSKSGSSRV
jgi:hypothetical protein